MNWQSQLLGKIKQKDFEEVQRLLDNLSLEQLQAPIDLDNGTALHKACQHGYPLNIILILEKLGQHATQIVAMPDKNGCTPLHLAAHWYTSPEVPLALLKFLGDQAATVIAMRFAPYAELLVICKWNRSKA